MTSLLHWAISWVECHLGCPSITLLSVLLICKWVNYIGTGYIMPSPSHGVGLAHTKLLYLILEIQLSKFLKHGANLTVWVLGCIQTYFWLLEPYPIEQRWFWGKERQPKPSSYLAMHIGSIMIYVGILEGFWPVDNRKNFWLYDQEEWNSMVWLNSPEKKQWLDILNTYIKAHMEPSI